MFRNVVKWSPVEVAYLKEHKDESINQLSVNLAKSRNAIKNKLLELEGKSIKKSKKSPFSNIGKRKDLGITCRSNWEANFLRYLNLNNIKWLYEPKVFFFEKHKTGTNTYTPDVFLPEYGLWVEVKGYMDRKDMCRLNRFKKYFPEEFAQLQFVVMKDGNAADKFFKKIGCKPYIYYNTLQKMKDKIPLWEE